uniref:Uncharacterized protein n=1 Tax=Eutreptiella gymnastica TaxID=73025 RepID=A0A7S4C9C6_9EUGL|mmetsp:Transcript_85362/g.142586  ORF Transcript_85362/g.142586 Transcript_85362/m.142586 type:complete len:226 (+) Transcript_85362:32-709(+)
MTVVASEEPGQEQGPVILSVLLSLGTIENPASDYAAVREKVCNALGTAPEHLEFFQLAPSSSSSQQQDTESSSRTSTPGSSHMGVRVKSEKMTLEYFKYLISENKRLRTKVEKTSEALSTLQVQNETYRKQLVEVQPPSSAGAVPEPQGSHRETRLPVQKRLEMSNRLLSAEVDDLRAKLIKSERFKKEVLHTVKDLKSQLAMLTEEILLNDWDMSDAEGSEQED